MDLTKYYFCKKYIQSYYVIFIDKESKISQFIKNWNAFAILAIEFVGNIF